MEWLVLIAGFVVGGLVVLVYFQNSRSGLENRLAMLKGHQEHLERERNQLQERLQECTQKLAGLQEQKIRLEERSNQLEDQFKAQKKTYEDMETHMLREFKLLATRVMDKNSDQLSRKHQDGLKTLLEPLRQNISRFEEQVKHTHEKHLESSSALKEQIALLKDSSLKMREETGNLVRALKGDNKVQGNWGELVLERLLEASGLQKDSEYVVQGRGMELRSDDGKRQAPDVVIRLPEERHVIIDAKVSLTAYERWMNCDDDDVKPVLMKQHIDSLRKHIRDLGDKFYQGNKKLNNPDFVLMFIPMESCFSLAIREDHNLFEFAWERHIVLVSPSTLLATLKTVASIWKYEHQNQNALEIAKLGGSLYDQFVGFIREMEKIGKGLHQAEEAYHGAMKKLTEGRQSLTRKGERLRELGVKNSKKIDSGYI